MAEENNMVLAARVYETLCTALDNRDWTYEKEEERLIVRFSVTGEDIPMRMIVLVDADRQLIRLFSFMPFKMPEDKRIEGAIATCVASYALSDGGFGYDIASGEIVFKITASFRESMIGDGLFQHMISCACSVVDAYNDKFLAIGKGLLSINDFINQE